MEVKERVMTMLFSSAAVSFSVALTKDSSGDRSAQVIAMAGTLVSLCKKRAAFTTSEVTPEREIRTGTNCRAFEMYCSGYRRISEAGTARAGRPRWVNVAAAAIAK